MFYLKRGLIDSWQSIKRHKSIFMGLIILQILFLISIAYIGVNYQMKIINNVQTITTSLENANYDPDLIEKGKPFIEDMFLVQSSYLSLKNNLMKFLIWLTALYLVFQGAFWLITHHITRKLNWIKIGMGYLKYIIISTLLMGSFLFGAYFVLKNLIIESADIDFVSSIAKNLAYASMVIYYFLAVAYSLLNKQSLKQFFKGWFACSIKKIHKTLPVMIINFALVTGTLYLIYLLLLPERFIWMILSILLLSIIIVTCRLFLVSTIQVINSEKEK
ncbi:MAG: hypothetical protein ABIH82_04495 [Candidatus Woesearchaeota archaeon]